MVLRRATRAVVSRVAGARMSTRPQESAHNDARWQKLLTEGHRPLRIAHLLFRHLPSPPRCKVCYNPFGGIGRATGGVARVLPSCYNTDLLTRFVSRPPAGGAPTCHRGVL